MKRKKTLVEAQADGTIPPDEPMMADNVYAGTKDGCLACIADYPGITALSMPFKIRRFLRPLEKSGEIVCYQNEWFTKDWKTEQGDNMKRKTKIISQAGMRQIVLVDNCLSPDEVANEQTFAHWWYRIIRHLAIDKLAGRKFRSVYNCGSAFETELYNVEEDMAEMMFGDRTKQMY